MEKDNFERIIEAMFMKKKQEEFNICNKQYDENIISAYMDNTLSDEERKKFGYCIWAERTLPLIKNEETVIDGIRSVEEVRVFKKHFPDFIVVSIHSSPGTRFQRIMKRKRVDDIFSKEKFDERDRRELSWGIGNVIALADVMIVNEEGIEEFKKKVEKVLGETD